MVDTATLSLFLATILVFILTPGPNMIFCVARATISGSTAGVLSALGVCLGLVVHATAAGLGLSQLFAYFPAAYELLKVAGAGYLIWLAWQSYRSSDAVAEELAELKVTGASHQSRAVVLVVQGALNALLSPKAVFFYLVLFPQFLQPENGNVLFQSLVLITIINAINFTVIGSLCIAAGRSAQWLIKNPGLVRLQRRIVSVLFLGLAARVLVSKTPA